MQYYLISESSVKALTTGLMIVWFGVQTSVKNVFMKLPFRIWLIWQYGNMAYWHLTLIGWYRFDNRDVDKIII